MPDIDPLAFDIRFALKHKGLSPTFPTGGGEGLVSRRKAGFRAKGLHYMAGYGERVSSPAAVIRGGGCGGRLRSSCLTRSFWSALSSV